MSSSRGPGLVVLPVKVALGAAGVVLAFVVGAFALVAAGVSVLLVAPLVVAIVLAAILCAPLVMPVAAVGIGAVVALAVLLCLGLLLVIGASLPGIVLVALLAALGCAVWALVVGLVRVVFGRRRSSPRAVPVTEPTAPEPAADRRAQVRRVLERIESGDLTAEEGLRELDG